jgi:hypothetical protein
MGPSKHRLHIARRLRPPGYMAKGLSAGVSFLKKINTRREPLLLYIFRHRRQNLPAYRSSVMLPFCTSSSPCGQMVFR